MTEIDSWTSTLLHLLQLLGIIVALFAVVVLLLGIVRSIARVTMGRATLVLPFAGSEMAQPLNRILVEQIEIIEDEARHLYVELLKTATKQSETTIALDVGPLSGKALHEFVSSHGNAAIDRAEAYIADEPVKLKAVSPLSLGGITVSPESIFAASYFIRRKIARRSISGSLDEFDGTFRLALTFSGVRRPRPKGTQSGRRARQALASPPVVFQRRAGDVQGLLQIVDDIAFQLLRDKFNLQSETTSWSAWTAFQQGYLDHVAFLTTGERSKRIASVRHYQQSIRSDSGLARAHYNLGNLLYDEYSLPSNQAAIEHFLAAGESNSPTIKALANAGLTMAYAQNVHRFELEPAGWIEKADAASKTSILVAPELEEAVFARAWSLQISGRFEEAVETYDKVVRLMGDSPSEVQIKSFALNNEAYLYLNKFNDPERAEALLVEALSQRPHKNMFANLGALRRRQRRFREALECYREARRLDPMYTNGINETGMVYLSEASECQQGGVEWAELIDRAYNSHVEALGTVQELSEKKRLRRIFEQHRITEGIRGRQARRRSREADRLVLMASKV